MKIICVGRNYAKHAEELNNPIPGKPIIFLKPDTAVLRQNQDFYYPEFSKEIHFECELVFRVSKQGKYVKQKFAKDYVDGIGLGIDFTARDLQSEAKEKGLPWELSKGFNDSAPVSKFLPLDDFPDVKNIHFECAINGKQRQIGDSGLMLFSIEYLLEYITQFFTIKKGDLIFTGTPAGVGQVYVGDHIVGTLEGKKLLDFHVK